MIKYFLSIFTCISSLLFSKENSECVCACKYENRHENKRYVIIEEIWSTYVVEIKAFLIQDSATGRYNVYVTNYGDLPFGASAKYIVKNFDPLLLQDALNVFETYLDESNYGF